MRSLRYIKYVVLCITVLLAGLPAHSQELSRKEERRLMKQLRQEEEEQSLARDAEIVRMMVERRQFVLEADQLKDRRGNLAMVSNMINFIAADSTRGILQLGNYTTMGSNGVGGVTLEGQMRNYEIRYNEKRGTHFVNYDLGTPMGIYHVNMSVAADGRADATITSNWSDRLTYMGKLVPPGASRVFKGRTF